jgi:hypothetical protein
MTQFTMPLTQQQEQFSIAYVHSIASAAGYGIEEVRVDIDSIDLTITQYGQDNAYPLIEGLRVQLKCTYAYKPRSDGIHFPLRVKNYNDLRRDCLNPRILVVLYTPKEVGNWLEHSDNYLSLYHCAYWKSLRGKPPTKSSDNVTITIPKSQQFTVDALLQIMDLLAQGRRP